MGEAIRTQIDVEVRYFKTDQMGLSYTTQTTLCGSSWRARTCAPGVATTMRILSELATGCWTLNCRSVIGSQPITGKRWVLPAGLRTLPAEQSVLPARSDVMMNCWSPAAHSTCGSKRHQTSPAVPRRSYGNPSGSSPDF